MNTGIFTGNITRDAVVHTTKTGKTMGSFSVACNRPYVDKETGETKQQTDFVNVVVWGNYNFPALKKGVGVIVIGRQTTRKYEQNGVDKYITEINASEIGLLMRPQKVAETAPDRWAGFTKPQEVITAQDEIPF